MNGTTTNPTTRTVNPQLTHSPSSPVPNTKTSKDLHFVYEQGKPAASPPSRSSIVGKEGNRTREFSRLSPRSSPVSPSGSPKSVFNKGKISFPRTPHKKKGGSEINPRVPPLPAQRLVGSEPNVPLRGDGIFDISKYIQISPKATSAPILSSIPKEDSPIRGTKPSISPKGRAKMISEPGLEDDGERWQRYDYTDLAYVKKKNVKAFNAAVRDSILASLRQKKWPEKLSEEKINELAYDFITTKITAGSFANGSPIEDFLTHELSEKSHEIFDSLQTNGILWSPLTERLMFVRGKLNEILGSKKQRSKWVNTFQDTLDTLINLPKHREERSDVQGTTPLRYLIDRLSKGIENRHIKQLILMAIGRDRKKVLKALKRWSDRNFFNDLPYRRIEALRDRNAKSMQAINQEHLWLESSESVAPIDHIDKAQVLLSYTRGNIFLPAKFIVNEKAVDLTGKLFQEPQFMRLILERMKSFYEKNPYKKDQGDLILEKMIEIMEVPEFTFPAEYLKENLEKRVVFINWLKVILDYQLKDLFSPRLIVEEGDEFLKKYKLLMAFLAIPKKELMNKKRKKIIGKFVRVTLKKQTPAMKEVEIKGEISANKRYIRQLHTFLRERMAKFLKEEEFQRFLFTELCKEIYQAGFDPRVSMGDVPPLVEKLLSLKEDDDVIHRLWTLLRFGSNNAFSKPLEYSWALVPDLFRSPYYTRAPVEGGMSLSFQIDREGFKVIQVRPFSFYSKKYPDRLTSTEVIEEQHWADIYYKWTIGERRLPSLVEQANDRERRKDKEKEVEKYSERYEDREKEARPLRTGILQFFKIKIYENTPTHIQNYIWNALLNYEKIVETDNIVLDSSSRSPKVNKTGKRIN